MQTHDPLQRLAARSGKAAREIARRLIEIESRGHGDVEAAMYRLQAKTGIDYWCWWHWRYREPPERILQTTWDRLVSAYRIECARKANQFAEELIAANALATGPPAETVADRLHNVDTDVSDRGLSGETLARSSSPE